MGFFLAISECQIFGWLALQSSIQQGFEYDRDNARRLLGNYTSEISYTEEMAIDLAIEESVIAKLRSVLSELSDQQRQVMNLSLEGLKVREIAQLLEVSENTVKMQKKRAYAIVRERMGMVWGILLYSFFSDFFKY